MFILHSIIQIKVNVFAYVMLLLMYLQSKLLIDMLFLLSPNSTKATAVIGVILSVDNCFIKQKAHGPHR